MADADKCAVCGEIIPEGIQVCPLCSKEVPEMGNSKNPYYNSEGYADPTAYGEFTARKYAEQKKTVIGGKSDDC